MTRASVKCSGAVLNSFWDGEVRNILVGCEYSDKVSGAFRKLGHNVTSCDLLPSDNNSPHHIQGDVIGVITSDGNRSHDVTLCPSFLNAPLTLSLYIT